MFKLKDVLEVARKLNIDFCKFSLSDLVIGTNIELEHVLSDQETNVTSNDLLKTMKIALTHLKEFPNYYNMEYGLPTFEKYLKEIIKNQRFYDILII